MKQQHVTRSRLFSQGNVTYSTFKEETCKVPDLKRSDLGRCYFDTSESICINISNKFTVST